LFLLIIALTQMRDHLFSSYIRISSSRKCTRLTYSLAPNGLRPAPALACPRKGVAGVPRCTGQAGRWAAWTLLESRKHLKPENSLKNAASPHHPLHAVGGTSFNLLAFLETTLAFWICTPDRMPQSVTLVLVLHTLSRRQAMPVQTG